MKKLSKRSRRRKTGPGMRREYRFDYAKARPNRFAAGMKGSSVAVVLDPDVARLFPTPASVNAALRALAEIAFRPRGGVAS